jgi:hypothetical protein
LQKMVACIVKCHIIIIRVSGVQVPVPLPKL